MKAIAMSGGYIISISLTRTKAMCVTVELI